MLKYTLSSKQSLADLLNRSSTNYPAYTGTLDQKYSSNAQKNATVDFKKHSSEVSGYLLLSPKSPKPSY